MTFAPHFQPRQTRGSAARLIANGAGWFLMWLGFVSLTFAAAIAVASPTAPAGWAAKIASPLILVDGLAIWSHLGPRQTTWTLFIAGSVKTLVVLGLSMVLIMGGPYRGPVTPTPFDDVLPGALLLTGPMTMLAAILRRLGR